MNFNFEELGIETVEYERFRDILTGYVQICVDQNYRAELLMKNSHNS